MVRALAVVWRWWQPALKLVLRAASLAVAFQTAFEPVLPLSAMHFRKYPAQVVAEFGLTLFGIAWLSCCAFLTRKGYWQFERSVVLPRFREVLWFYLHLIALQVVVYHLLDQLAKHSQELSPQGTLVGATSRQLGGARVRACALITGFTALSECASFWLWYFVALAPDVCNRTLFQALVRALAVSVVAAMPMWAYFHSKNAARDFHNGHANPSLDKPYQTFCALWLMSTRVVASAVAAFLTRNDHRRTFMPYFLGSVVCGMLQPASLLPTPAETVVPVVTEFLAAGCLLWSFVRETNYWRGGWCEPLLGRGPRSRKLSDHEVRLLSTMAHEGVAIDFAYVSLERKPFAEGTTSVVFRGSVSVGWLKGKVIVFKVFRQVEVSPQALQGILEEAHKAMHDHPRILKVYGLCVRPPDVMLASENCEHGSLSAFLCDQPPLDFQEKLRLAIQATEAVEYLHTRQPPIVHRDLKALNFLVTASRDCKLADFGTCQEEIARRRSRVFGKVEDAHAEREELVGSPGFLAPEGYAPHYEYTTASDVFSLSIVLVEIWAQCNDPYKGVKSPLVAVPSGVRPQLSDDCPTAYRALVQQMWSHLPHERPTAAQVLERLRCMAAEP